MRQTFYIIRSILLIWTILIFVYLNRKTTDNIELVEEFKFEKFDRMMDNVKSDSTPTKAGLNILDSETTRFTGEILEDSARVREGMLYLMATFGLFIAMEVSFSIASKRRAKLTNK